MSYIRGWANIGKIFGVSGKVVRTWAIAGAPVLQLGANPVTRLDDLWAWLLEHRNEIEEYARDCAMSANAAKRLIPEDGEKALLAAILNTRGD